MRLQTNVINEEVSKNMQSKKGLPGPGYYDLKSHFEQIKIQKMGRIIFAGILCKLKT